MATKLMNFRLSVEEANAVEREAKRVPYRTVSAFMREAVLARLPKPPAEPKAKKARV